MNEKYLEYFTFPTVDVVYELSSGQEDMTHDIAVVEVSIVYNQTHNLFLFMAVKNHQGIGLSVMDQGISVSCCVNNMRSMRRQRHTGGWVHVDPVIKQGYDCVISFMWKTRNLSPLTPNVGTLPFLDIFISGFGMLVCWSLTSLCHSNGHIETMPAREINPFTALTRIRSQFLRMVLGCNYKLVGNGHIIASL